MTKEQALDDLADLYQVLGALMDRWKELGITVSHMDALIEIQRIPQPPSQ